MEASCQSIQMPQRRITFRRHLRQVACLLACLALTGSGNPLQADDTDRRTEDIVYGR